MINKDSKIIILDYGIYSHRAIFGLKFNTMPIKWTVMRMFIGDLKKVGVTLNDQIIVACDGRGNWRKTTDEAYKADRTQKREDSGIDFYSAWGELDELLDQLDSAAGWNVVKIPKIEADDVMAVCSRYFKDNEVILLTYDKDMHQMLVYPNVKIFNIHPKKKIYEIPLKNFNPYALLANKVTKEKTDNLITDITTVSEYDDRESIVNLLELPSFVEEAVINELKKLNWNKPIIKNEIPCKKYFFDIYNSDNIVTYEQSIKKQERKNERKRSKARKARTDKKDKGVVS